MDHHPHAAGGDGVTRPRSLAALMLANRPELAAHLAEVEAQMRAPRQATTRRPRQVDLSTRAAAR